MVKSNVIKMNLNNSYGSIKNKNLQDSNVGIVNPSHLNQEDMMKKQKNYGVKQNNYVDKNQSNINMASSNINTGNSNMNLSAGNMQKRPRVNASLSGPMNR